MFIVTFPRQRRGAPGDGTLDAGFGEGGKVITDVMGPNRDYGRDVVAIQADGKILVAGETQSASGSDFALIRYNPDGSLDVGFGLDGIVTTDIASSYDGAYSVAIQADGKIVVAGLAFSGHPNLHDFALVRYNNDGTLDAGFGGDGKVTTDFGSSYDYARAIAIQADGKIVVAGYTFYYASSTGYDFALARYNSDGTLDTGFDSNGKVTTDFASPYDYAQAVAIQADGKIVVAGYSNSGSPTYDDDFALARYNNDGTLDAGFGGDGTIMTDLGSTYDRGSGVAIQADGKIVVVGFTYTDYITHYADFALARYNSEGTLDNTFGSQGVVATDFGSNYEYAYDVAIQADGKIVGAGNSYNISTGNRDFALTRYNANGSLDTGFDSDGKVTTDFGSNYDYAYAVDIQADGKIVAVGSIGYFDANSNIALARYEGVRTLPLELLALLVAETQELVSAGDLNNGNGNALLVKLQAAIQQLDRDNIGAAINQLQAFINQVDALMIAGVLTMEEGQPLIDAAQEAIDGLAKPGGELVSEEVTPSRYQLFQNYPNPFNAQTTIEYALTEASDVTVDVYDLLGRRVAVLIDEHKQAGYHSVNWDATTVASGAYFYRIQAGENVETRKMVLLK